MLHQSRKKHRLLLLLIPAVVSICLFQLIPGLSYLPAAFLKWTPPQSLWQADFVGFRWFSEFFAYHDLWELVRNTLILGGMDIILLPIPLVLALASFNNGSVRLNKVLDIAAIIPMFIPTVVVASVVQKLLGYEGLISEITVFFGGEAKNFLLEGELFYVYFSLSGLWSGMGFPYLVYKSCLTTQNQDIQDAAKLDGCGLFSRIVHIQWPMCKSVFLINLAMQSANVLSTNTERLLYFHNNANSSFSTTIDLYIYNLTFTGSMMPAYSKAIAVGLISATVNIALLMFVRYGTRRRERIYE